MLYCQSRCIIPDCHSHFHADSCCACQLTAVASHSVGTVDIGTQVCTAVQQQLHTLSLQHQTLLEKQAGVVTQASDSVQLRAELAKTRLDLAQALDQLVAVQATHRQAQMSQHVRQESNGDSCTRFSLTYPLHCVHCVPSANTVHKRRCCNLPGD